MTQAVEAQDNAGWFAAAAAEELRSQLARKRISGRELGRRLHVSAQWISQRTKGEMPLRVDEIERICDVLGISPATFVTNAIALVTESQTRRYTSSSMRPVPTLSLVPDLPVSNRDVAASNGSSPPAASYGEGPIDDRSAGSVNNADAA